MSKPKVAIYGVKYFPSKGGTSRVAEQLLRELKDKYDFTIYCYKHPDAQHHIEGVRVVQFPEMPFGGAGVFLYFLLSCLHLIVKGKYDMVHIHKTDAAFFLPMISKKYPTIITSHALPYLNDKWSSLGKAYFHMVERIFIRSKAISTSISSVQSNYYKEKYNCEMEYIPNGIYPVRSIDTLKAEGVLKEHGVNNSFIFFAARRIIPLKGCHTMIKALKEIGYKGTLLMAGDTEQLPAYTQQIKTMAEGLDVKFIGYIDMITLFGLVKLSDFFLFPSEIEGMSMMLLEVAAVGTPIIASDIPPNKAVFSREEVLFFESKNVGDMALKLFWSMENPGKMEEKASRAQEKVYSEYSMEVVSRQYDELYQRCLHGVQRPKKARSLQHAS